MLTRISAATAILVLALLASGTGTTQSADAQSSGAAPLALTLPNKEDSLKFAVLGDFGTGSKEQYQLAAQMKRVHDQLPIRLVDAGRRQPVRVRAAAGLQEEVRRCRTSRCSTRASSSTRRSAITTRANSGTTSCSTWTASCTTRSRPRNRASGSSRSRARTWTRQQVAWFEKELKDSNETWKIRVLPPSAVFVGERARIQIRSCARSLEPLFMQVQRQRGADRPRSLLRADQAAEGNRLLRLRIGRAAAEGEHRQGVGADRGGQRPGSGVPAAEINGDQMWFDAVSRRARCSTAA